MNLISVNKKKPQKSHNRSSKLSFNQAIQPSISQNKLQLKDFSRSPEKKILQIKSPVESNYLRHKPSVSFGSIILSPCSRFHVIMGAGDPVAAHFNVTLLPSRTIMSVLVGKSRMSGGTESRSRKKLEKFHRCINQQSIYRRRRETPQVE